MLSMKKNAHLLTTAFFLFFIALFLTSCEGQHTIVNSLDEKEANEILVFLATKGIDAQKVMTQQTGGGAQKQILFDIVVPKTQATEALSILNRSGLPRRRGQNLLGIFSDVGLVPSEMQERIRYQAGIGEQIANTIRKIDGVLDAEVQISFPEEDPLNPGKTKGEIVASVYVKHSGVLDDPNTHLATKIKLLVMSSVTGLKFDNVTVISDRARFRATPEGRMTTAGEEKEFVKVWTIIVANESVFRFRILFFTFILITFLLVISMIWIGWKVHRIVLQQGGVRTFFHLAPLEAKEILEDKTEDETKKEKPPSDEPEEEPLPKDVT